MNSSRALAETLAMLVEPVSVNVVETLTMERDELQTVLNFRLACDAAFIEGQLARSIGLDLGANPYSGLLPAERICPERALQDFHFPWIMGWRAAHEQDAVDALMVAAQAATRDGTVVPLCLAGEGLRDAVATLLERRVKL